MTPQELRPLIRVFAEAGFKAESWQENYLYITLPSKSPGRNSILNKEDRDRVYAILDAENLEYNAWLSNNHSSLDIFID